MDYPSVRTIVYKIKQENKSNGKPEIKNKRLYKKICKMLNSKEAKNIIYNSIANT